MSSSMRQTTRDCLSILTFTVFILTNTLVYARDLESQQQRIVENPTSQQARIGDQVILKCKIENLSGEPQWCIDDFCLGFSKKLNDLNGNEKLTLKGRPRHKIIGDRSKGEYHLLIEPVQLQDNMYFYCMATAAVVNIKAVKSDRVFLTVLTNPQSLYLPSPVDVSLNKASTVQCTARQSRPPVNILIAINGKLITDKSRYSTEIIQKPIPNPYAESDYAIQPLRIASSKDIRLEDMRKSFYDTITNLTLNDVKMNMQDQLVECFVYSFMNKEAGLENTIKSSYPEPDLNLSSLKMNSMNIRSKIQVNYAPEVSLEIMSTSQVLKEEDVISLVCKTKATPGIQTYTWYIDENFLPGVGGANLNLKLRKEMHMKTITCEATNSVASVKASIQLDILFKPSFLRGAKSFMLINKASCNQPLTLDCQVSANPGANVTWYRRRLNENLQRYLKNSNKNQQNYFRLEKMNINDYYYDEPIGTGPTYTIASFNCANQLAHVKNMSLNSADKAGDSKARVLTNTVIRNKRNMNENDKKPNMFENLELSKEYEYTYEDYLDSDFDYENEDYIDYENENKINIDFAHNEKAKSEFDDFGIYICEATNVFQLKDHVETRTEKRYIKINPIGPPNLHIVSSSSSKSDLDKMITSIMVPKSEQDYQTPELAASLGKSIQLTCLIEPLPDIHTIVWVKDNGKIIPNSKYSILESSNKEPLSNKKKLRNYRVKHENISVLTAEKGADYYDDLSLSPHQLIDEASTARSDSGLMRSVLYIKNVRMQDLGVYKCKSSNSYGSRTATIMIRKETFLDKINMNDSVVFTSTVSLILVMCAMLVLTFMCIISKRIRDACCCFCFVRYSDRVSKEKELLSQNSNCEQHSDKTINEWLASSKLSNETGTSSLINAGNNTSTTTAATILNGIEHGCLNLHNTLSKSAKSNRLLINTPLQMRRDMAAGNCSSLLNDDMDDDHNSSNEAIEQNRRRNLGLLNEPSEFNATNNTFSKRDEARMGTNNYQASQFNRFLVSSPLLSSSSSPKESSVDDGCESRNEKMNSDNGTQAATKAMHMPPMMTIRSQNLSNGNFNAKITAGFQSSALNDPKNQVPKFNTFTLNRNLNEQSHKGDNSIYDNSKSSANDLTKMLQDTTFRLSDLFNELSPNLINNNSASSTNTNTLPNNNTLYSNRAYQSTLPKNINSNSLFQQMPSVISASSPKHPILQTQSSQLQASSRQNLLQAMSNPNQLQANSSFNKFPNPFTGPDTMDTKSSTSKFYTNFYRNPNLRTDSDNCNLDETSSSTCTNSLSNVDAKKNPTPSYNNSPIAKIVTTSSENGNKKYQTVV